MDPQIIGLVLFCRSLNLLPYKLKNISSGRQERGNYGRLTPSDTLSVSNWAACPSQSPWYPGCSAFHDVWISHMNQGSSSLLKLYSIYDLSKATQGLVYVDHNAPCADKSLRLLETAPNNQDGVVSRGYSGVGKALVARLVIECYLKGQQRLYFRVSPRNIPFYIGLNFVQSPVSPGLVTLGLQDAEQLLKNAFF